MRRLVDRALDASIVGGFSRLGPLVRSRLGGWERFPDGHLLGRSIAVTGPTSGLGRAAVAEFDRLGADLVLIGRDAGRLEEVRTALSGSDRTRIFVCDMGDLDAVARAAKGLADEVPRLDALVHNAGALTSARSQTVQGFEGTLATHVLGPQLMTRLLRDRLVGGRVVTVSSGGMYAARLPDVSDGRAPEVRPYDGTRQYALAKRLQVTLNEIDAAADTGVFHAAMHPGWADTPGVRSSLPGFARVTSPILRTADEGADTIVWLVATGDVLPSGRFWCDRAERPIHRLPATRNSDRPDARLALRAWVDAAISRS